MRDELAEKQETIQEFSRLMGLAHFKGQNSDREALQLQLLNRLLPQN